jgi:deoxyribonuclease V
MKSKSRDIGELENYYNAIQYNLKNKISFTDSFKKEDIKKVSGVDLAYWNDGDIEYAVCCIVTIDYNSKEITEMQSLFDEITVPYIPGYLSFRELPLVIDTFKLLKTRSDVVIFDGNGYLHYKKMGIATLASFYINKPTIGVAKSYLRVENTDYSMPKDEAGSYTDIIINNTIYGRAIRTRKGVKPIFVSCGNRIALNTATDIVLNLTNEDSRQPLPTRLADIETKKRRKHFLELSN